MMGKRLNIYFREGRYLASYVVIHITESKDGDLLVWKQSGLPGAGKPGALEA